jgi:hypothetical protein
MLLCRYSSGGKDWLTVFRREWMEKHSEVIGFNCDCETENKKRIEQSEVLGFYIPFLYSVPQSYTNSFLSLLKETEMREWSDSLKVGKDARDLLIEVCSVENNDQYNRFRDKQCHWTIDKALIEMKWYIQRVGFEIKKDKEVSKNITLFSSDECPLFLQYIPLSLIRQRVENALSLLLLLIYKYHTFILPTEKKQYDYLRVSCKLLCEFFSFPCHGPLSHVTLKIRMPTPLGSKKKQYELTHKEMPFEERYPSEMQFVLSEIDDVQVLRLLLAEHCGLKDRPDQVC